MSFDLKIINGDLVIKNGELKKVEDSEKLIQDILKICLTTVGSNPIHPWYGSYLSKSIIGTSLDSGILQQISKSQLSKSLENLQNLQNAQIKTYQRMSGDEQIGAILDILVLRNPIDYRLFDVKISALSKGRKPITTAFKISTI